MNRQLIGIGGLSIALIGCTTPPIADSAASLSGGYQAAQQQVQTARGNAEAPIPAAGLIQAPSAQQVIESFPEGRVDPFGAIPVPVAFNGPQSQRPTPEQIRETLGKLQVLGFVKISGRQAVFVQHDNQSGEVYLGQVGGESTEYLPDGWKLVAVEGNLGRIALARQDLKVFIKI